MTNVDADCVSPLAFVSGEPITTWRVDPSVEASVGSSNGPNIVALPRSNGAEEIVKSIRSVGGVREYQIGFASRPQDFEAAFRLVAANYQAKGYDLPSGNPFRFTPYHILPGTALFVARREGRVVATLSLVPDTSLLGLPMEGTYGEEIASQRRAGRRLAEATSLADEGLSPREFILIFTELIKLAIQFHLRQGGDTWVIAVNPHHSSFYRKVLGFVPLGPRRSYAAVQEHPAEAYILDIESMRANAPKMYQEILGEQLPETVLTAPPWSPQLARHLGSRSTHLDPKKLADLLGFVEHLGSPPRWQEGVEERWDGYRLDQFVDSDPGVPISGGMELCGS